MKQLIGSDIGQYVYNPVAKTITISGLPNVISHAQVLLITNLTAKVMLYSFADATLGATVSGNVITLDTSTTGQAATDNIQILMDLPQEDKDGWILRKLFRAVGRLSFDVSNQVRVSLAALPTLTTCSTVTNMTTGNIGMGDMGKPATAIMMTRTLTSGGNKRNIIRS